MRTLRKTLPTLAGFWMAFLAGNALPASAAQAASAPASAAGESRAFSEMLTGLRVRAALLGHLRADAFHVSVEVKAGAVTLTGEVKRRSSRDLAEPVVRAVTGVASVDNRLTVAPVPGSTGAPLAATVEKGEREVRDALLETRVKTRLLENAGTAAFAVEVEATDGVVSLTGTVAEPLKRDLIEKTAKATPGVKEVHSLLKAR